MQINHVLFSTLFCLHCLSPSSQPFHYVALLICFIDDAEFFDPDLGHLKM
ncbi:hypothetical protein MtrunA17_Chr8g0344091 [Medicago truncatula]|uniref:Transmembrane protein n=1 Tax=Medicago truncatula TaxID=3880 RepID=A0A396GLD1_MEDTR|nr:hypothetical protein MtrunA17_Chr8g0344091 [Medicago truncatula]